MTVTLMTVAHPWQCDQMGHLNVRFYAHAFDDAGFHFLGRIAGPDAPARLGWADVRVEIDYRHEVGAGTLITITSHLGKLGRTSISYRHVMSDSLTGRVLAEAQVTTVRFDLDARRAVPLEDGARARAGSMVAQ